MNDEKPLDDIAAESLTEQMEQTITDESEKSENLEYQQRIDHLTSENQKLRDQFLRLAAEFDNYRKRSERDAGQLIVNANTDLVSKLLSSLDDLDRIINVGETSVDGTALLEGVRLLHKNLFKVLQDEGLRSMDAVDQEFDPEFHDALLHIEYDGKEPNLVVEEHKKGYLFKDRVLRHAQVIVSK
jgi:molecular chaperone GrpE